MQIDRSIAISTFETSGCCGGGNLIGKDVIVRLRRAGKNEYLIEYPAHEIKENSVSFYWDELFYNLENGRYIGDIYADDAIVGEVQLYIDDCVKIGAGSNTKFEDGTCSKSC